MQKNNNKLRKRCAFAFTDVVCCFFIQFICLLKPKMIKKSEFLLAFDSVCCWIFLVFMLFMEKNGNEEFLNDKPSEIIKQNTFIRLLIVTSFIHQEKNRQNITKKTKRFYSPANILRFLCCFLFAILEFFLFCFVCQSTHITVFFLLKTN